MPFILEVDEQLERDVGVGIEHASLLGGVGSGANVALREDVGDGVEVKTSQCAGLLGGAPGVADQQLIIVCEPHVGLHAGAAGGKGLVEWHAAPIVVVGVAALGDDVAAEVVFPLVLERAVCVGLLPLLHDLVDPVVASWWLQLRDELAYERDV